MKETERNEGSRQQRMDTTKLGLTEKNLCIEDVETKQTKCSFKANLYASNLTIHKKIQVVDIKS